MSNKLRVEKIKDPESTIRTIFEDEVFDTVGWSKRDNKKSNRKNANAYKILTSFLSGKYKHCLTNSFLTFKAKFPHVC